MANHLIINLRKLGDVISTAHLIHSIKKSDPSSKIGILTFEESKKAANIIGEIDYQYTVDRKQIISLRKNKIFSNAYALNTLFDQLDPINQIQWDNIINYSNDKISGMMASYLKNRAQVKGISFNGNIIQHSDEWSMVLNDVLTSYKHTPIHFQDCYHNMNGITFNNENKISKFKEDHEQACKENFEHIRDIQGNKKLIAIQLFASTKTKSIPYSTYAELTEKILESQTYYPIFLIAPIKEEKDLMEKLNHDFGSTLISIEADFLALSSVLRSIDLLITPDTSVKHLADINEIPLVEISLGEAPMFKQSTTTRGNLVLTLKNSIPDAKTGMDAETIIRNNTKVTADDIILAIDYYFLKIDSKTLTRKISDKVNVYEVGLDRQGIGYNLISASMDLFELKRKSSREVIYRIIESQKEDNKFFQQIMNIDLEILNSHIQIEKNNVTQIMKDLLSCLRSILKRKDQNSPSPTADFFQALDQLLSHTNSENVSSIPVLLFSAELETICGEDPLDNLNNIEALLYKLKKNIQIHISFLKEIENDAKHHSNELRMKSFQDKRHQTTFSQQEIRNEVSG